MTKTYSETRQQTYFTAAVEMYKLVIVIADENIDNPPEGEAVTEANKTWAASLIETTYAKGQVLEANGHDEVPCSTRQLRHLSKHREAARARTAEGRALRQRILDKLNS